MQSFVTVMETIGSVVGVLLTLITFFGIISKKPKDWFKNLIREQAIEANKPLVEKLEVIEKRANESSQIDIVILRHEITNLYNKYKDKEEIPAYAKADWLSLYEKYEKLGGNSYVHEITNRMKNWKEV